MVVPFSVFALIFGMSFLLLSGVMLALVMQHDRSGGSRAISYISSAVASLSLLIGTAFVSIGAALY